MAIGSAPCVPVRRHAGAAEVVALTLAASWTAW